MPFVQIRYLIRIIKKNTERLSGVCPSLSYCVFAAKCAKHVSCFASTLTFVRRKKVNRVRPDTKSEAAHIPMESQQTPDVSVFLHIYGIRWFFFVLFCVFSVRFHHHRVPSFDARNSVKSANKCLTFDMHAHVCVHPWPRVCVPCVANKQTRAESLRFASYCYSQCFVHQKSFKSNPTIRCVRFLLLLFSGPKLTTTKLLGFSVSTLCVSLSMSFLVRTCWCNRAHNHFHWLKYNFRRHQIRCVLFIITFLVLNVQC